MLTTLIRTAVLAVLTLTLASAAAAPPGKLLITGSSTMAPLIAELGQRFQASHPGVQLEVQAGGSGRGISDALAGKADMGMASRALTDTESGLYSFALGRDGVAVMVHKDNPVQHLSNQQVADIFSGRIANWRAVGGRDATIGAMPPKEGYGSIELFTHFFKLGYADIRPKLVVGDNSTRIKAVLDDPDGITFISLGSAERQANAGVAIKLLPADGVAATSKNIRSGNFPISRPLLLLTRDAPSGLAKEFIDFVLSSQATELIEKYDFVPYLD